MINRRHIRIKVMQSAYALLLSENDKLDSQEKFLLESIEKLHQLYVLQYKLLIALHQKATEFFDVSQHKHIYSGDISETSSNFVKNKVLLQFKNSVSLALYPVKKKETDWQNFPEIVNIIWSQILASRSFTKYLKIENPDFYADKKYVHTLFKEIIAPNEHLAEFFESEVITWVDDIPFVNTWIINNLNLMTPTGTFILDPLYKDPDDKDFALQLFRKTILNYSKYEIEIDGKTPNWDSERITKIDKLLMVMGIAEFLNFPSIPTKVTINEYIELAKDYATQKSSFFINGVLDKIVEDYNKEEKIQKVGRGLL
jgi:N utilization substance protein B